MTDKTFGRVTVDVSAKEHAALKVEAAKRGVTLSRVVRAFLVAWLKKDARAESIVSDFSTE